MSEATMSSPSLNTYLREIPKCIRKDFWIILLIAVLVAGAGAVAGKVTNKVTSTAQLVLSPMPLYGKSKFKTVEHKPMEDELESMLATPLDIKSTSLLCMSDEVLQQTLTQVNEGGQLPAPIKDLMLLKNALSFQVAVEKETPYDITYTPLIELTARAKTPADAKAIVNVWAKVVVEAAKKFQDAIQTPAAKALEERTEEVHQELSEAEAASEKFWTENNPLYLETRLNEIGGLINTFKKERSTLQAEVVADQGTVESLEKDLVTMPPKISLEWKPSQELLGALGAKLGLTAPKKDEAATAAQDIITLEEVNKTYWEVTGELSKTRSKMIGKQKKIQEVDTLVEGLEKQRLEVQAEFAKTTTGKLRAGRDLIRMEEAFHDMAMKREFAQVASRLNHPPLQIISQGAEWPLPRFRRAIAFGGISGVLGLVAAAFLSVSCRLVLKPLLQGQ